MKTETILLSVLALPVVLLWFYILLLVSTTVDGLIRIITGLMILTLIWLLRKYEDIDYTISLIMAFLIAGIAAQLGVGLLIESLTLSLPLLFIFLLFQYRNNIVILLLIPTAIYLYTLLTSYAASIGLSYKAALASFAIIADIGRVVITGKVPVTTFYEPIPGLIVLYAASIIALILLIMDLKGIRGAGLPALEEAVKVFSIALLLALGLVYIVLFLTRMYVIVWSITATAIFIMSCLVYRLLTRDNA